MNILQTPVSPGSSDSVHADTATLRDALRAMASFALAEGDDEQGGKYGELAAKLERGDLTAAFCGHFSAGKSTLVNALCGASLLPSSPIPTSANVVTIRSGEPAARMVLRDAEGNVRQERDIEIESLHGFAVDGEGVASIEVAYPIPLLGGHMAIVDTPGVDSTDSAHRAATESALHLADVVFYVTDYNHVLSDVNFRFLRALADWGKPTYVIVNQIDKHRESEVAFETFRQGIVASLKSWRIEPAGVLYLSLRKPDHPLSQWDELLSLISRLEPLRGELMVRSTVRSAVYLADRFRETLHARHRDQREKLQADIGEEDGDSPQRLADWRARLTGELEALRTAGDKRREALRGELDRLTANANLTPAETRDKAGDVLESLQPGFKVGWFASAAKTEAEQNRRMTVFADDFNRQIAANLNGHVRELLRRSARETGWDGEAMEDELERAFPQVTAEWLRGRVKPGMGADGQATLHYAAELSADVKAAYRKSAMNWQERLEARRASEIADEERRLLTELAELERQEAAAEALAALETEERREMGKLLALLPASGIAAELALPRPASVSAEAALAIEPISVPIPAEKAGDSNSLQEEETIQPLGAPGSAADSLERAAGLLASIPALSRTAEGLSAKAERFRRRKFTIALFGAFSAGKSSFANALAGQPALPVSPNPTTATINRIVAPSSEQADGVAMITMKAREAMLGDIRHSLKRLGVARDDLETCGDDAEALLKLASRMPDDNVHPRGKPHLAFLRAAAIGWDTFAPLLDTRFAASGDEYRRYAADEQASCFVAEIDLAVDAPLIRGGAVLVDTPGADSINARHTGVAFEYIKNADAVLFVTYYNHAFTEADRQFLNQLGSVKDVFELDKMFFIINAADLAASEEELQAVKEHVAAQLLKHGIRNPRLFAVSSMKGLEAKRHRMESELAASGLAAFESAFRSFAQTELGELAAASARKELDRAGKQLDSWLQSASADAASRDAKALALFELAEVWRQRGSGDIPGAAVQPLRQETEEQLYHLRQRVFYRFNEHFQSAFHPSVLQDDGRDLKKLLTACWDDLKRGVGEDLQQELRSAGLRIEVALQRAVEARLSDAASELAAEGFAAEPHIVRELDLPIDEPFATGPQMEAKRLWQSFKSPKHFFENEGKSALRDTSSELLFQAADEWLAGLRESWISVVTERYRHSLQAAYAEWANELAAYAQNLGAMLQQPEQAAQLADIRRQWQAISAEG